MCGIHAIVTSSTDGDRLAPSSIVASRLKNRGPDYAGSSEASIERANDTLRLGFFSTVLSLRGDQIGRQPLVDDGSALCWNGEAWGISGKPVKGNDAATVFQLLIEAANRGQEGPEPVLEALRSIDGPFAFVFFDKLRRRLYYGRDRLGRRSLLVKSGESFELSSIADKPHTGWTEVEADGCYTLDLDFCEPAAAYSASVRHMWNKNLNMVSSIGLFNMTTSSDSIPHLGRQSPSVKQLRNKLAESLQRRVLNVPVPPSCAVQAARIAILFSGGLDCTVLARLASDIVPPDQAIDLINVAFENPRIAAQHKGKQDINLYELCPDRITGRKSYHELLAVCPTRPWRFVTVNVPFTTTCEHRAQVIDLIYPHNTEMDLSIALALYFASRGKGLTIVGDASEEEEYTTTARVLLSGLGADELFGGYVRHPNAYTRGGYKSLVEELELDVSRLGKRNLGRDDRALAHWGREVRFPYLDEAFVRWAIALPVWEKCDFSNTDSEVEVEASKRILRLLACELGMTSVAGEKKRAIQFGARTAKMENSKVKGTTLLSS